MFDLSTVEASNDYDVIPQGYYPAFVDSAEWKMSKAGAKYLSVMWKIFGDNYSNRVVFDILNLTHEKEQVRNIALGTLKKMLETSGIEKMAFTTEEEVVEAALKCRCIIKLGVQKDEQYGDKNTVKGYKKIEDAVTPTVSNDVPF